MKKTWVLIGIVSLTARGSDGQMMPERVPPGSILRHAFERAVRGPEEYKRVEEELSATPAGVIVPDLLATLRGGPDPLDAELRTLAYTVLAHHKQAGAREAVDQLVKGLDDSTARIQRICCVSVGPDIMREQLTRAKTELLEPSASEGDREAVLKRLGGWGPCATELYGTARVFFADATHGERVRWAAVRAMLEMRGLAQVIDEIDVTDPVAQMVVMWYLPQYLIESRNELLEGRATDKPHLPRARSLVLKAMRSRKAETRRAAFEAAPPVFGWDMVVKDKSGKDIIDPNYEAALREMAASDPDPALREAAAEAVGRLDERLESVLRKREKLEVRRD